MSVKFRPVHTGKFHFAAYRHTACAAHPRAVHHNRVQAYHGGYVQFFRHLADEFHHNHRSDSHTDIIVLAFFHKFLDCLSHHAMSPVRTVIRRHIQIAGHRFHFLFQYKQILCLGAHDDICLYPSFLQPFHLWVNRRRAYASSHKQNFFLSQFFLRLTDKFRRTAKRPHKIMKTVARFQPCHLCRLGSNRLKHNGNGSLLPVIVTDRKRDSFPLPVLSDNDKLPRLASFGNPSCFHYHKVNIGRQFSCL